MGISQCAKQVLLLFLVLDTSSVKSVAKQKVQMYRVNNGSKYQGGRNSKTPRNIIFQFEKDRIRLQFKTYSSYKIVKAPFKTVGEPWPQPQQIVTKEEVLYRFDVSNFKIVATNNTCDVVEKAIQRYKDMLFLYETEYEYDNIYNMRDIEVDNDSPTILLNSNVNATKINTVSVLIRSPCSHFPSLSSDESYTLLVKPVGVFIVANEVWGALRGLETFSQLIFKYNSMYFMRDVSIRDFPRFPHRGILLDTARHFIQINVIHDVIDGMAMNKMNVLHWHIVDDQSFPYQSRIFPDLSGKGAFHPSLVYTPDDVAEIIEYARLRGVRVIPEFDIPAHTYSWGFGYPELLTQCYDGSRRVPAYFGPMNPTQQYTYDFLAKFFKEAMTVFKDQFFHLGGDEVPLDCWSSNSLLKMFAEKLNKNSSFHSHSRGGMWTVVDYFTQRVVKNITKMAENRRNGIRYIFWEEAMQKGIQVPKDSIIQIWYGNGDSIRKAIDRGFKVLYSSCWYLDYPSYGVDWPKYYRCDLMDDGADHPNFVGGEVCMWSEFFTNENLINRLWPRGSAAAERLWSNKNVKDVEKASRRLQEHTCRMLRRGLNVGNANGPDYCLRPKRKVTPKGIIGGTEKKLLQFSNPIFIMNYRTEYVVLSFIFPAIGLVMIAFLFRLRARRR